VIEQYKDVIGLTGIIGSGKSTVAQLLKEAYVPVIDADNLARRIFNPEYAGFSSILDQLNREFNGELRETGEKSFLLGKKEINRPLLAHLAFKDQSSVLKLNKVTHTHVQEQFKKEKSKMGKGIFPVVYDIPLLFEVGLEKAFLATVVVYAPEELCIKRAALRTGLSHAEIKKRINLQISIEKKKEMADIILDNSSDLEHIESQINELLTSLKELLTKKL
jgi:dephospho-CoA kinase